MRFGRRIFLAVLLSLLTSSFFAQSSSNNTAAPAASFEPLEHWRQAVLAGDSAALQAFYSTQPPAMIKGPTTETQGAADELQFWKERKQAGLASLTFDDLDIKPLDIKPGEDTKSQQVIFQAVMTFSPAEGKEQTRYLRMMQSWQQQKDTWRIVQVVRDELTRLELPLHSHMAHHNLFPPDADAQTELDQTLIQAKKEKKRVLLFFGANWCYDCHVLDAAFHRPDLQPLVESHYVVLHVDIGGSDVQKNRDLAERFQVPVEKGVPALAVVKNDGTLLFSQQNAEFKSTRDLGPEDLQAFLEKWK